MLTIVKDRINEMNDNIWTMFSEYNHFLILKPAKSLYVKQIA